MSFNIGEGKRSGPAAATGSRGGGPAPWSPEEQKQLETAMKQFPPERHPVPLDRYLRIALSLPGKTARDVALRVRWLSETSKGRKRKTGAAPAYGGAAPAAATDKGKARPPASVSVAPGVAPAHQASHATPSAMQAGPMPGPAAAAGTVASAAPAGAAAPSGTTHVGGMVGMMTYAPAAQPVPLDDHGASSVGGVGGPIAQLLEANYAILNQFKANMQQCRVHENTDLLVRFRDNILSILNQMNSIGGVMAQMPPLPVRMNVELANNFLPKAGMPHALFPPLGLVGGPPQPPFAAHGMPPPGMPVNGWQPGVGPPPGFAMQPGVPVPGIAMPHVSDAAATAAMQQQQPQPMETDAMPTAAQAEAAAAAAAEPALGMPLPPGPVLSQQQPAAGGGGPPAQPAASSAAQPAAGVPIQPAPAPGEEQGQGAATPTAVIKTE